MSAGYCRIFVAFLLNLGYIVQIKSCASYSPSNLQTGNEICGIVVSIRYQEDMLSIWNRTATDEATKARIRDALKRLLNLHASATMEYKMHMDSLK